MPATHAFSSENPRNQNALSLSPSPPAATYWTDRCHSLTLILSSLCAHHYAANDENRSADDKQDTLSSLYGCSLGCTHCKTCANTISHSVGACIHLCKLSKAMTPPWFFEIDPCQYIHLHHLLKEEGSVACKPSDNNWDSGSNSWQCIDDCGHWK